LAVLRRVAADGSRYRWQVLALLVATAAVAALSAVQLQLFQDLFDRLQAVRGTGERGGGAELAPVLADLQRTALWMLAGAVPMALVTYLAWNTGQGLANRCTRDLRGRFVAHLVRLDLAFHGDQRRGELLTRMTADLDRLYGIQSLLFGRLLQRPAQALGCAVWLFWSSWQLGAAVLLVLLPVGVVIARILRTTRRRSQRAQESLATALTAFEQITAGIRVIKTMGSTEREVERYAALNHELFCSRRRMARARGRSEAVTQGAVWAIGGIVFLLAVWLVGSGMLSPAQLLTSLTALGLLVSSLREAQSGWASVVENLPSAERVYEVLDTAPRLVDRAGALAAPAPQRTIRFEQVSFRYRDDADCVLEALDLVIPVGQVTALVGESGGGKSTVLDLLPRLREVSAGRVTWDGVDVRDLQADSLIRHCAIVSQEPFLFDDTIRANLAYGRPEATEAELVAAARRAHVHDDILGLEGGRGYDTVVGDRGGRLSGGQRQRLAIARALLRDAPILLLDEPTSALDAGSERHVQQALDELMRGRTTLVIAHRLATVQHAHTIVVLGSPGAGAPSRVLETGSHGELVARGGRYAELVRLQRLG
jgi:subfamily B ATP-binding cassette protein MsbA